jgi:hypothetical protein
MRPNLNVWKLISIALAATFLVMLLSSRVDPTRADSQNDHFTIVQGIMPFGVQGGPPQPLQTMFRLDTTSGEVQFLGRNVSGAYQWSKLP